MMKIPIVVQYRHVHLSAEHQATLFGAQAKMTSVGGLGHRGQEAYQETVSIIGKGGRMDNVRVLGPTREATQIELSATDAFALGLNAPVRVSGDLERAASCVLVGPNGEVKTRASVIIPARHLHCNETHARRLGLTHHQLVTLAGSDGNGPFTHVTVRVHPTFALEFHVTADEAAEHWLQTGDTLCLT